MSDHIDNLDASLARNGEDVILRRYVAGVAKDVTARAHVRSYRLRDEEIVPKTASTQEDFIVRMSPTEIAAAGWPGTTPFDVTSFPVGSLIVRGDKLVVRGRERNIQVVDPLRPGGQIVRFNMRVLG